MAKLISRLGIFSLLPCLLFLFCTNAYSQSENTSDSNQATVEENAPAQVSADTPAKEEVKKEDSGHSFIVGTLLYIPNRVLDLLDIFRFRVRVGPGIAAGVRATKVAQLYAGTYASVYVGLPGPRLRRTPKSPVGLESSTGVTASVVDATVDAGMSPDYSPTEFGAGVQLGIIGFDFGVDPVEIADFVTGIFTIDLRDDDL